MGKVEQHLLRQNILRYSETPVQVDHGVRGRGGYDEGVSRPLEDSPHTLSVPESPFQLWEDVLEPGEGRDLLLVVGALRVAAEHLELRVGGQHGPHLVAGQQGVPGVGEGGVLVQVSPRVGPGQERPLVVC